MRNAMSRFFFTPASPTNLGVLRILLFGYLLLIVSRTNFTRLGDLPDSVYQPISFFHLIPHLPSRQTLVRLECALWLTSALSILGLFTRGATVASTVLALYLLGLDSCFGKVNHQNVLLLLFLLVLIPAPWGAALSLDRLIGLVRGRRALSGGPSWEYAWPVRLLQVVTCTAYFFAGYMKVIMGGWEWVFSSNFQRLLYIRLDQLEHPPRLGFLIAQQPNLCVLLALFSVLFELNFSLVLFFPMLRWVMIPGGIMFHAGIKAVTNINFTRFMTVAYLPFIEWENLYLRVRERTSRLPHHIVLYDDACPLCRRTVAVLAMQDVWGRLDFRGARDRSVVERDFPGIDPEACLRDMHLVSPDGRVALGYDAYTRIARLLPIGWCLLPVLHFPGVSSVGRIIYRRIADTRLRLLQCAEETCSITERHASG